MKHSWKVSRFQVELKDFRPLLSPQLLYIIKIFETNNYEIRLVGGCIRDLLLGVRPHDIDLATTAMPDQMIKMFDSDTNVIIINTNGKKYGILTVQVGHDDCVSY
ncbi:unnamed protein product [Didymodactylos carnosus]|uniref:Poly A polymerase head domain-containing protein n=1 Tax=Didymodactylos carnosus TaxID=1234261 RepID=A0A816CQV7_9BILA|nr:unnamed protein product [Didymodactylos carnosus]CAF4524899.1 unnamed protein product [Didymodactylos carnosus]